MLNRAFPVLLLGLLVVTGACSHLRRAPAASLPTPRQQFYETYMRSLQSSNMVYEETLRAVGRAKASGLVTEGQEAAFIEVGRLAQHAIEAARDALLAYLAASSDDLPAQARVLNAVGDMNLVIGKLTEIVHMLGRLAENDDRLMAEKALAEVIP